MYLYIVYMYIDTYVERVTLGFGIEWGFASAILLPSVSTIFRMLILNVHQWVSPMRKILMSPAVSWGFPWGFPNETWYHPFPRSL